MPRLSGVSDALVLAPEVPYPVIGGGPSRTASLLEYLRSRGRRVHVVTFCEHGASDTRAPFPGGLEVDVIRLRRHSKNLPARLGRNLKRALRGVPPLVDRFSGYEACLRRYIAGRHYRVAIVDHFWCAPYAGMLKAHSDRLALNLHNIDSVLLDRCAAIEPFPSSLVHRRFAWCCRHLEAELLPLFDDVLVPSEADASRLGRRAIVYPNAIPLIEQPQGSKCVDIVFSGNLEYSPNLDALRWFAREIWPRLRHARPSLTMSVIGRNHHNAQREIRLDGVCFTGPVEDAVSAIASGRVAVVPVRAGSGTRVKIIEAWAAGVPVVSTSVGAEGFAKNDALRIADDSGDFADSVLRLLQEQPEQYARRVRALYEQMYSWPAVWPILDANGL